jgi:hypothetical protein
METILTLAENNTKRAWEIIDDVKIFQAWESIGATINLVGSLSMGLMMKHKDIDFHVYSDSLDVSESFRAMAALAAHPSITQVHYNNLADTSEVCLEWHAWYRDKDNELWQLDIIHILRGSTYDGFFEKMAARVKEVITEQQKETILRLKYETPETEKIIGVEYYQAVIRDNVQTFEELLEWKSKRDSNAIIEWIP